MKKLIFTIIAIATLFCFVGCAEKTTEYKYLDYEVISVNNSKIIEKDDAGLVGLVFGGLPGLIIADVASESLDKLDTGKFLTTEKYTLKLLDIPLAADSYGLKITVEGPKDTWKVGDRVTTVGTVSVTCKRKNGIEKYNLASFNNATTDYFTKKE